MIGLNGYVTVYGGHVELVASDCENVEDAAPNDRVLVSCGVVLIHQSIPNGYVNSFGAKFVLSHKHDIEIC